jgi:hypothetical protein
MIKPIKLKYKVIAGKPGIVQLIFPETQLEKIEKIYQQFYKTEYDRTIYFNEHFKGKEPKNEEERRVLLNAYKDHISKTYVYEPKFFEVMPIDKYVPKDYSCAIEFFPDSDKDDSVTESIVAQFSTYLWKKEIPFAQHRKVARDDKTNDFLEQKIIEQNM